MIGIGNDYGTKAKGMKSRKYIIDLRKYPEIGKKLLEKYS